MALAGGRYRCVIGGDGPVNFGFTVVEPFLAPDPVECPAQSFEVFLAEPVAVPGGRRRVVRGSVTLDREDHLAGPGRVLGGEVDPVAGAAVLGDERDTRGLQLGRHVAFEWVEFRLGLGGVTEVGSARLGVGEVSAEQLGALERSRAGSMSAAENEETTVIRARARVTATLSRRSPPSLLTGPKRYSIRPSGFLP